MRRSQTTFVLLTGVVAVVSVLLLTTFSNPLIQYPILAGDAGWALFLFYSFQPGQNHTVSLSSRSNKLLVLSTSIFLTGLSVLTVTRTNGVPDTFYPLVVLATVLIAIDVLFGEWDNPISFAHILLISVLTRAALWFSYPIYGQDSKLHTGIMGYIANTGTIIPSEYSYYSDYPLSHLFGAAGTIISGVEPKLGMFLFFGLPQVLAIIVMYSITLRIFDDRRLGLFGALLFGMSAGMIHFGSELYAQTIGDLLFVFALFSLLLLNRHILYRKSESRQDATGIDLRVLGLFALFAFTAVGTHNLAPLAIGGTLVLMLFVRWTLQKFNFSPGVLSSARSETTPLLGVLVLITVSYWTVTGYIGFQINRIANILSLPNPLDALPSSTQRPQQSQTTPSASSQATPSASEATPSASEATSSTPVPVDQYRDLGVQPPGIELQSTVTELFGVALPEILMWSLPLLVIGVAITFVTLRLVDNANDVRGTEWLVLSVVTFAGFAVAFVSGGLGSVSRAIPVVTMITIPAVAFVFGELRKRGVVGVSMALLLITSIAFAGVATTAVAIPERSEVSFEPTASAETAQTIDFISHHGSGGPVHSEGYVSGAHTWSRLEQGQEPSVQFNTTLMHSDMSSIERYTSTVRSSCGSLIYRDRIRPFYALKPPQLASKVYSTGSVHVFALNNNQCEANR